MAEKNTTMVLKLKVDLQCSTCYKKIKKILCKFPQIRDQIYDEKQNTVTIVVVCCSPEKVRDKLYCKGGKTIKSIEIKEPPKPKPPEKKKEEPKKVEPKKEEPKKVEPKKEEPKKPPELVRPPDEPKKEAKKEEPEPKGKPPTPPPKPPQPAPPIYVPVCYPLPMYPVGICCKQCSEGRNDGPCHHGHGRPVPSCDNYGYGPCGCGGNRGCYTCRCDYFSEENPSGCTIM